MALQCGDQKAGEAQEYLEHETREEIERTGHEALDTWNHVGQDAPRASEHILHLI